MLTNTLKSNKLLFYILTGYFIVFTIVILLTNKCECFVFVNSHNSPIADFVFYYLTALGNGFTFVIITVSMVFISYRFFLMFGLALGFKTLVVQLMKLWMFPGIDRPFRYFFENGNAHIIQGVQLLKDHSFPSGHTSSAFCLAVLLCLILKNKNWQVVLLLLAMGVGYSRIYIGQHFSTDVYAGSVIGIVTALIFYLIFVSKPLSNYKWLDNKLIIMRKKNAIS